MSNGVYSQGSQRAPSPSTWGQRQAVREPEPLGSPMFIGLIAIDGSITGNQRPGEGGIPATRDWTVYLSAEGNISRPFAPNVEATVTFGSGASAFKRVLRIPTLGAVMHMVSTALSVDVQVLPSGGPANGDITVSAFASPGRPTTQREIIAVPLASYTPGDPILLPPFTTAVSAYTSIPGSLGAPEVRFEYNNIPRGAFVPAAPVGRWDGCVAVPRDVNAISLTVIPPGSIWANIMCEVEG